MTELEQYFKCCLEPEYYKEVLASGAIIFSDRYVVKHVDHWTCQPLIAEEIMFSSGFYPGVKQFYPANRSTEKEAKQECRRIFEEINANCNTCKHLKRFKHPKNSVGMLYANCLKKNKPISFHPDDCLNLSCYEHRDS